MFTPGTWARGLVAGFSLGSKDEEGYDVHTSYMGESLPSIRLVHGGGDVALSV